MMKKVIIFLVGATTFAPSILHEIIAPADKLPPNTS